MALGGPYFLLCDLASGELQLMHKARLLSFEASIKSVFPPWLFLSDRFFGSEASWLCCASNS